MENNQAILVGLHLPGDLQFEESLAELKELVASCGYETVSVLVQRGEKPTPGFLIGRGKVDEIKALLQTTNADVIIFDQELSPVHFRNLEAALEVKVLDRTMVILEIFEQRAHSPVAKLQVSLARDQYMLPRIIGQFRELSRQRGATSTIGGPGEQKLELERRRLHDNIIRDRRALAAIVRQRRVQRKRRSESGVYVVAIVGYTNAGKSTLLNRMTAVSRQADTQKKKAYEEDRLFATLETAARAIVLDNHRTFVAVDTVGFVRSMPAHLIAAFRSTLEEITEADLILHVFDGSSREATVQIDVVYQALSDIGVIETPIVYVRNKIDLLGQNIPPLGFDCVDISALTGAGFDTLLDVISRQMDRFYQEVVLCLPYADSALVGQLEIEGRILSADYGEDVITLDAELPKRLLGKYYRYITKTGKIDDYHRS
ncbi:MAG: GTPase HflX [Bacilli bacterium]|jgi:GTP-binding protein HflX